MEKKVGSAMKRSDHTQPVFHPCSDPDPRCCLEEGGPRAVKARLEGMRLIARAMASELARKPSVLGAWLIGSVARGNIWEGSDIDLQVMVERVVKRIECRRINDETIITKFLTKAEIYRSVFEDEDDPVICGIRDCIILHDPNGWVTGLKWHAEQTSRPRRRSLGEMVERLEETWESWQGARKAKVRGDRPALALALTCIVRSLMGLLYALEGIRMPSYATTEENLARLPGPEAKALMDCLGITRLGLGARFERLTGMLTEATEKISRIYGDEIARFLDGREMTYREIEKELGAGIPIQLTRALAEEGVISVTRRPVMMLRTTFYEEVYSTPRGR